MQSHLRHSASEAEYSDHSYTGIDPPHTSDHSHTEKHNNILTEFNM